MRKVLTDMERDQLEAKAMALLKGSDVDYENGVDIVKVAKSLGFVVGNADLEDKDDGFILVDTSKKELLGVPTSRLIAVNKERDYYHKRFIIAHELAHYDIAGRKNLFAQRESTHGRTTEENEVDFFAACLLMPAEAFKKQFEKHKHEGAFKVSSTLSEIFGVKVDSVLRRIDELELKFNA